MRLFDFYCKYEGARERATEEENMLCGKATVGKSLMKRLKSIKKKKCQGQHV